MPKADAVLDEAVYLLDQELLSSLVNMMIQPGDRAAVLKHPQYPDLAQFGPSLSGVDSYSTMP